MAAQPSWDKPTIVVAGILKDAFDRFLIQQRPPGEWMEGRWEFPGGKVKAGEYPKVALARELKEELDVTIGLSLLFSQYEFQYPGRAVITMMFFTVHFSGVAQACERQLLKWVPTRELSIYDFTDADYKAVVLLHRARLLELGV